MTTLPERIRQSIYSVLFLIACSCNCLSAFSQAWAGNKIRFHHFSFEHNLSQHAVTQILQDKKGYMWFATHNGIVKYDGYVFTSYQHDPSDKSSLPDNLVMNLFADAEGNLWYTTDEKQVYFFDRRTEKFIAFPKYSGHNYPEDHISALNITLAPDGKLWFACGEDGIALYDPATGKFSHQLNLPVSEGRDNAVNSVLMSRNGILYLTTHTSLYSYNTKTKSLKQIFGNEKNKTPFGIFTRLKLEDMHGMIWLTSAGEGAIRYNPADNHTYFYSPKKDDPNSLFEKYLMTIYEDRSGTIWLGGYASGLSIYQPVTDNFITIHADLADPKGLNTDNILSIFQDRSGILWIGTNDAGILTVNSKEKKFNAYTGYYSGPDAGHPLSILKDHEGKIWVGTFHSGIHLFNPANKIFTSYRFKKKQGVIPNETNDAFNNIMGMYEDSNDTMWFCGTFEGLHSFNRHTGNFTTVHSFRNNKDSTKFNISENITEDADKRLWIATDNGLKSYDLITKKYSSFEELYPDTNNLSWNSVFSLYCDVDGILWVGSQYDGITRIDTKSKEIKIFHHDDNNPFSLSYNSINFFFDNNNGKLFIGTDGGGLNVFDKKTEKFFCYTMKDGLPDNNVKSILQENKNTYWLNTNNGLCKITFETGQELKPSCVCRNYNTSDGLVSNETEGGAVRGDDGTFYFCSNSGLVAFKPGELKDNEFVPPVVITTLDILNKPIGINDSTGILKLPLDETKEITLPYDKNIFSISFASLNYIHPEKNRFAYKLEGFDHGWNYTDASKRFATYTHLDAGTYTFKVKASNNDGVWNNEGISMTVTILPPFWKTWWFRLILIFTFGGILFLISYSRLQKYREIKRIRNKLAIDLHDDLGATLSSISIMSEIVLQETKNVSPQSSALLEKIGQSSRNMIEAVNDLVWTINPKNDTFENIIRRMRMFASDILGAKEIDFTFEFDKELLQSRLKMENRKNFYLIFKEAVNNIAKYSGATTTFVLITHDEPTLKMIISDNGKGFDMQTTQRGNGLNNMQQRADEMNARFILDSKPGQGTSIEIEFKNETS